MKVLVFEHLCGGAMAGDNGQGASSDLYASGKAMWRAAVAAFVEAGCAVVTTVDRRFLGEAPVCERVVVIECAGQVEREMVALADECDAVLVIAPEEDGALARWAKLLRGRQARWLGCDEAAIELCGDKLRLAEHWRARAIATPETMLAGGWLAAGGVDKRQGARWVVKPRFGVGCERTRIVDGEGGLEGDGDLMESVVQPYVEGRAVSVSLIVRDNDVIVLPAGAQEVVVRDDGVLEYCGGCVPLADDLSARATALAKCAVACVAGLNGYVGVDLILGREACEDCVIEINPRLTMSFLALSAMCKGGLAKAILGEIGLGDALQWSKGGYWFDVAGHVTMREMSPAERCP